MNLGRILWVAGGYLVGTFPSTYLIARAKRATTVLAAADRGRSEADAHVLMKAHMGGGWGVLAATIDVVKGLVYPLVARHAHLVDTAIHFACVPEDPFDAGRVELDGDWRGRIGDGGDRRSS